MKKLLPSTIVAISLFLMLSCIGVQTLQGNDSCLRSTGTIPNKTKHCASCGMRVDISYTEPCPACGCKIFVEDSLNAYNKNSCNETDYERAKSGDKNLSGANLYKANLCEADLRSADLANTCLFLTNLAYADLSGADLSGADIFDVNFIGSILDRATIDKKYEGLIKNSGAVSAQNINWK